MDKFWVLQNHVKFYTSVIDMKLRVKGIYEIEIEKKTLTDFYRLPTTATFEEVIDVAQDFLMMQVDFVSKQQNTEDMLTFEVTEVKEGDECKYKQAYDILSEYWDSIADEEKPKVHKKLVALGV